MNGAVGFGGHEVRVDQSFGDIGSEVLSIS